MSVRSRVNCESASNHALRQRLPVVMQSVDVKREGLFCIRDCLVEIVAFGVKSREIRGVHVVAALLLRFEDEFNFAIFGHKSIVAVDCGTSLGGLPRSSLYEDP